MRSVGRDALFSLAALLVSVILVQSLYATVIRPRAEAILAEPAIPQDQLKPGQPVPHNLRSPFVILKDYEQEAALILATWALSLIAYQALAVARNRGLLEKPYIEIGEGHVVLPDDARAYGRPIENLPREEQEMLLPRALLLALLAGGWIDHQPVLRPLFDYTAIALAGFVILYGFCAAILPVWLLLAPRDYLSTFLKLGTVALLAVAIVLTHPQIKMPAVTAFT